jgi:hypothetical protein
VTGTEAGDTVPGATTHGRDDRALHDGTVGSGPRGPRRRPLAALLGVGLAVALATGACGGSAPSTSGKAAPAATMPPGPACITAENGGGCLQVAPGDRRVDLIRPSFSNPTSITNPLHPSSKLAQVIYGGQVDGKPLRTEFTRLPATKTITWDGQQVETVVMQYVNYLGGRIEEVALDWFAQADDGAVWYFGEDVFNYADGAVADTQGSWIAGKGGPPAMIMPASPKVGNVYRSENMPGVVFEEVTVKAVGQTVPGPSGPVGGALTANELHFDGKREDKVFAPGYGEFSTGDPKGDLELASLAVPTDARPGPLPAELAALSGAIRATFDRVGADDWSGAATATRRLRQAWDAYRSGGVPEQLVRQMQRDVDTLAGAVAARTPAEAHAAALRVAQNDLDLRLQHRPAAEIDLDRLRLWARQLQVDTAAGDPGAVAGDVTTMEWTRDRVRHTLDQATAARLDDQLRQLRAAAGNRDLPAAAKAAPALLKTLAA